MSKTTEQIAADMKELIEWMEQEIKGHQLIGSDYGLGFRSGIGRCIAKAKELEAANCDHKDCRNNSKDLRQMTTNSSQPDKWAVVHITDEYDSPEEAQEHIETIDKKMRQYYRIVKIS